MVTIHASIASYPGLGTRLMYPLIIFLPLECQLYAQEMLKHYDLTNIDGILVSSGDGLLFEVCYSKIIIIMHGILILIFTHRY